MLGGRTYTIKDSDGAAVVGVTVSIYKAGTDTLSTIYSSGAGAALANPVTSIAGGIAEFYAVAGFYDVRRFKTGYHEQWERGVEIVDDALTAEDLTLDIVGSTTAGDIIKSALRKIQEYTPGEAIDDAVITDNLEVLNNMLDFMSAEGLLIPYSRQESFTLTTGQSLYTIGPGGDFATTRPISIDERSSFIRKSSLDTYLEPMTEREYKQLGLKSGSNLNSQPGSVWYDPQFPLGRIQFSCPLSAGYTLYLTSNKPLDELPDIFAEVILPPGYKMMLIYNLAVMLADEYGKPISAAVGTLATQTRNQLKHLNAKPIMADLRGVPGGKGRQFDFYRGI